ncbi:MAG TPA: epoxyalkane--coenzyme M transferase, partial [Chloroflexota bacterium]
MKHSEHRILTTHAGSLIRPAELLELAARAGDGDQADRTTFEASLRQSVVEVVRKQADIGLDIVSDGEYGKSSWAAYVLERLTGFELHTDRLIPLVWLGRDRDRFRDFFAVSDMPGALHGAPTEVCVGPITYTGSASLQRDLANFRRALQEVQVEDAFFTAVAPASTAYNGVNEYYPTERDYVYAIADALREEYRAILDANLLLQVDDAVLANMYDWLVQQSPARYREWAQLRVDALNHALEGIPEERVRYHVCFGSWHVPHVADAPLEEIVDFILQVRAGAYSIEAANPRHEHEWRVWE